jgi:hypothetical protein
MSMSGREQSHQEQVAGCSDEFRRRSGATRMVEFRQKARDHEHELVKARSESDQSHHLPYIVYAVLHFFVDRVKHPPKGIHARRHPVGCSRRCFKIDSVKFIANRTLSESSNVHCVAGFANMFIIILEWDHL